jgi:DNA-binding transcriptional LysR family regulator
VILREPLVALLPADHPACWQGEVALADLAETPFCAFPANTRAIWAM